MLKSIEGLRDALSEVQLTNDNSERWLLRAARGLIAGYEERLKMKLPPQNSALSFIKRGAYITILKFIAENREDWLQARAVAKYGVSPARLIVPNNPFHWGLLLMFHSTVVSKDVRRLCASQLLYAHRHDVPENFLIGFLYQIGTTGSIYAKVRTNMREPWCNEREP